MSILVGSYEQNIYEVEIDKENHKFLSKKTISKEKKPSFLIDYRDLSYIYMDGVKQYVKLGNDNLLISNDSGACHLSYDDKNKNIYTSFYGAGVLKVLSENDNKWSVSQTIEYEDHSHIHFALYIDNLDLVGVCDLGDHKFYLYENINQKLVEKASYSFKDKEGPRHFIYNKSKPIIYVLNEHKPSVTVLSYENGKLELVEQIKLIDGAGSAIRISKDNKYLYVGVRLSNYIFAFEILDNGKLKLIQKISSMGDHPRDFNLVFNDKYLIVANMHSNDLALFRINNGKLYLEDKDFKLNSGASIMAKHN